MNTWDFPFSPRSPQDITNPAMNPFKGSGAAVKPQQESPEQALAILMKEQGLKMTTITEKVSPAEVQSLLSRLKTDHDTKVSQVSANSYDIDGHGVKANAAYDVAGEKLTINIFSHPFYMPVGLIQKRFEELLKSDGAAAPKK